MWKHSLFFLIKKFWFVKLLFLNSKYYLHIILFLKMPIFYIKYVAKTHEHLMLNIQLFSTL